MMMTTTLAHAIAQWKSTHPGQQPEIRDMRHRSIEYGETVVVQSDPLGLFAPDVFVVARAVEDFVLHSVNSTVRGVVITITNVSRSSMPRRFDGWLVGRSCTWNSSGMRKPVKPFLAGRR